MFVKKKTLIYFLHFFHHSVKNKVKTQHFCHAFQFLLFKCWDQWWCWCRRRRSHYATRLFFLLLLLGEGRRKVVAAMTGGLPDSLEPRCNSLIETEWDVLITPVVKTRGGEARRGGRMLLWSLGWRSLNCGGTTPINTGRPGRSSPHTPPTSAQQRATSLTGFNPAGLFHQDSSHSLTMKGHFSIEWMAQSSQTAHSEKDPGPATCGTHSESLPGFYCRQQKFEEARGLDLFDQQQTSQGIQGKRSPSNSKPPKAFHESWQKKI